MNVFDVRSLLLFLLLLQGCDFLPDLSSEPATDQYVVESYLTAGEELQRVRVMRPTAITDTFDASKMGVTGARVEIALLNSSGQVVERYPFESAGPGSPGVYEPVDPVIVKPRRTYRLRAVPSDGSSAISSTTTVPDTFRLVRAGVDTVRYGKGSGIGIRVTESSHPTRQSYYMINNIPKDASVKQLTPAGHDLIQGTQSLLDYGRKGYTIQSLKQNEWPITNESSYPHHEDGTMTVRFPWVSVLFYGHNQLDIHVIDDNLYDFVRSNSAQKGGPSPAQIPNVIDHVDGGTGVFGSMSTVRYEVRVARGR